MSILVDDKPIEIVLRYVDKSYNGGAVGAIVFDNKEKEQEWVNRENKKRSNRAMELKALNKDVPESLEKDASEDVKQIKTFWKRMDWGTQTAIIQDSRVVNASGEHQTDWTKYRMSQMKHLMIGWDLKAKGEPIPINDAILKRLDFNIAISLLNKYESEVSLSEEDMENLD